MGILTSWRRERYVPAAFDDFRLAPHPHPGTARALMWLSQLAYEPNFLARESSTAKVNDILASWGLGPVRLISVPVLPAFELISRDALVVTGRGAVMVAFAGTDPLRLNDWATNFNQMPSSTGVASGFARAANAVIPELKAFLNPLGNPKVFFAGHSLGGALAVALAYELHRTDVCRAEAVYSYGMPRAGDGVFAADYESRLGARTSRFVHGDDIVPAVPPPDFIGSTYHHVGRLVQCAAGAKFDLGHTQNASNAPERSAAYILSSFSQPSSLLTRMKVAAGLLFAGANVIEASTELLAPRVRQHLQDQYIAALTP
jgi:hypothetical protein